LYAHAPVLAGGSDLVSHGSDLRGAWVVGVDLDAVAWDWSRVDVGGAVFAGCDMSAELEAQLRRGDATVVHELEGVGFDPFRVALYANSDLMHGYVDGEPGSTLDARIGALSTRAGAADLLARGVHDACIDAALMRFLSELGAPVVGVMGSHTTPRGSPAYVEVAALGRRLTRAGFVVATGGGPGLMEAANLGAWFAHEEDDALSHACQMLSEVPSYHPDAAGFLERALAVRTRWRGSAVSLGIPTWVYVDEPVNQFATHIAKYFQNSIRENGLLAIAHAGIIYTPGGSGTLQEMFTDAAQNEYTLYDVRSPMILMGAEYRHGHLADAANALRVLAERGGWAELVRVVDGPDEAFAAVRELLPPVVTTPRPEMRKR
jgi:predicted Rossmann-fold nucleotide-binding protein